MFQNDLQNLQSRLSLNSSYSSTFQGRGLTSDLDLQYELYYKYMHISKQQIAIQELMTIKDSQTLIQSFNFVSKADISLGAHSTMECLGCGEDFQNSLIQDFTTIQRRSPKKITRKGSRHSAIKPSGRANDDSQQMLNEIQRKCTETTFSAVKSLLAEHNKNLSKIFQVEKKQKNFRRLQQKTEKAQQQNVVFRAKMAEIEEKIKSKDEQIKCLKEKLSQLKSLEKQNIRTPQKVLSSTTKSTQQEQLQAPSVSSQNLMISSYLTEKQLNLAQRMTRVQQIETRIQTLIQNAITGSKDQNNACNKCCQMIKKIKDSVMQYRAYLEQQGQQNQRLYNMLKTEVESCLSDKKVQIINI